MNMQRIKIVFLLVFLIVLSGCAATGATYQDAVPNKAVDSEKARLVLFRTRESTAGFARTASVKLDGQAVEGVKYAGFTLLDANPGLHTLTVDLPDTYGKCILPINAVSGKEYYFQIRPRIESLGLGGAVGGYLKGANVPSPTREDCKGSFFIEPVEDSIALEKLKELKSSQ
jgi:hypothetical protein